MPTDSEGRPEPLRPVTDLRGTPALDVDGQDAGEVFGSMTEADSGLIRYLDLAVARSDRHVLVPIGHARLEEGETGPRVRLRAVTREELTQIPAFQAEFEQLEDEFHQAVLAAFGRFLYGERYYAHPSFEHSGLYAGEHPVVPVEDGVRAPAPATAAGEGPEEASALLPLTTLRGYRVADGEPDIRGWPVRTRSGRKELVVRDLVVDRAAGAVRYVSVSPPEGGLLRLIPVGYLVIRGDETVCLDALTAEEVQRLPIHDGGAVRREEEERLRGALSALLAGPRRFERPDFTPPHRHPV